MKKLLLSIIALACGMSMNAQEATTGTATRTGGIEVKWVQLWENGPKFAEYNVGVEDGKADSYGGYYCWGGSIDKDENGAYKDGIDALSGTDDTATNLWGSAWRMPTKEELDDLLANCDVEWRVLNTLYGYKFTGKGNYASNSVFLPAAGAFGGGSVHLDDHSGYYWSATPNGSNKAYYLYYYITTQLFMSDFGRASGCSVRAVLAENNTPTAIEGVADNAISTQRGGKKVIQGGKLTIMGNNGKMYNTVGIEIKK